MNRGIKRDALRSVQYAAQLFDRPKRFVWIYPQGIMQPNDTRPLRFASGAARIISIAGRPVQVLPFAHRYEFSNEQRPDAFTLFGTPIVVTTPCVVTALTRTLETTVTELLDRLRSDIVGASLEKYHILLRGRASINVRLDHLRRMNY